MEWLVGLIALAAMEIVLGIDNIVFLTIVTSRLPKAKQPQARRLGLLLALVMRIALLCMIKWIMSWTEPLFYWSDVGLPAGWFAAAEHADELMGVSLRDLILIAGGLFLIGKSVHEIHEKMEQHQSDQPAAAPANFVGALLQIALMDLIFSLDSVITAVGMVQEIWVMITAIVIAIGVMLLFANPIGEFVERHPTLTMLALSFLILIGVMLVAEGLGTHIDKGYIYFAMAFSLVVEFLNMRVRGVSYPHTEPTPPTPSAP